MELSRLYQIYLEHPDISTDSRKIRQGSIFFALKGPHFDGNRFAGQALDKGAAYAVISDPHLPGDERLILVKDTLDALQELATFHRSCLDIPLIAITGSNGKTTTKELVSSVLSMTFRISATQGNLNNHIGIPLTLLGIGPDIQMAVIEMGANHLGEIAAYCRMATPTHGLITNIGRAHLEGFGGIEGVRKGKGELFDYMREIGGMVFYCPELPYLRDLAIGIPRQLTFGESDTDIRGRVIRQDPYLWLDTPAGILETRLLGRYNYFNIMAALAVGSHFGVPFSRISQALRDYIPSDNRSQVLNQGTNTLILDAYNANPSSMQAAIENLRDLPGDNKILLLGAMLELGNQSLEEHQKLVDWIGAFPWKEVVLVGGDFAQVHHSFRYFLDRTEAAAWWRKQNFDHSLILIKGSRAIGMEGILS